MMLATLDHALRYDDRGLSSRRLDEGTIYTTSSREYHCEAGRCIEVRDAATGRPLLGHPFVGLRAMAVVSRSALSFPAIGLPSEARPGRYVCFAHPRLKDSEHFTAELEGIEYRGREAARASMPELDASPRTGVAVLSLGLDALGTRVTYADAALAAMSGYTLEQLRSHSARLLAGTRPSIAHVRAVSAAMSASPPRTFLGRQRKQRPDGSTYDVELRIEPLRGTRDGIARVILLQRELG